MHTVRCPILAPALRSVRAVTPCAVCGGSDAHSVYTLVDPWEDLACQLDPEPSWATPSSLTCIALPPPDCSSMNPLLPMSLIEVSESRTEGAATVECAPGYVPADSNLSTEQLSCQYARQGGPEWTLPTLKCMRNVVGQCTGLQLSSLPTGMVEVVASQTPSATAVRCAPGYMPARRYLGCYQEYLQ